MKAGTLSCYSAVGFFGLIYSEAVFRHHLVVFLRVHPRVERELLFFVLANRPGRLAGIFGEIVLEDLAELVFLPVIFHAATVPGKHLVVKTLFPARQARKIEIHEPSGGGVPGDSQAHLMLTDVRVKGGRPAGDPLTETVAVFACGRSAREIRQTPGERAATCAECATAVSGTAD